MDFPLRIFFFAASRFLQKRWTQSNLIAGVLMLAMFSVQAAPQCTELFGFSSPTPHPSNARLLQGSDGSFYGTTSSGGKSNYGTIFKLTPTGAFYILASFTSSNGPYSRLFQDTNGNLYGTSYQGGASNLGTVFRLSSSGVLSTLAEFSGTNGANPCTGLVQGGTNGNDFVGTTLNGGTRGCGTIFQMSPSGKLTCLVSFDFVNGGNPLGELAKGPDGNVYGTTYWGFGTVFTMTPLGALTTLVALGPDSACPYAGLALGKDGYFYGATSVSTNNGKGRVFRVSSSGAFLNLSGSASFDSYGSPHDSLVQGKDGNFYGTRYSGSQSSAIFRITPSGVLTDLVKFSGTNAPSSLSGLILGSDGNLYGSAYSAGPGGLGTLFTMTTAGTFNTLLSMKAPNGADPQNLVQGSDGNFFGVTYSGGANDLGTVFKVSPSGVLTTLVSFASTNGVNPNCRLLQAADGNFYGTTESGGTNGYGAIFKVTTTGKLTCMASFNGTNGRNPIGPLAQGADGSFYGVCNRTLYDCGTIFSMNSSGALTALAELSANGTSACPSGGLTPGPDGSFYGTAEGYAAAGNYGSIFKFSPPGTFTLLASFNNSNGALPRGGLLLGSDGNFYGTTSSGGAYGYGTAFQVTPTGVFTSLVSFNGANPAGRLIQGSDGLFYGTTTAGGANPDSNGCGTIFCMSPSGGLATLFSFSGTDGAGPNGLLQGSDGNFYGVTTNGGSIGGGNIFCFTPRNPPLVLDNPASQTSNVSSNVIFTALACGTGPLSYLWQRNSTNLNDGGNIAGSSSRCLTLNNVSGADIATYSVIISNSLGIAASAEATLTLGQRVSEFYKFAAEDGSCSALVQSKDGCFYGLTSAGGASSNGTIFKLTLSGTRTTLAEFNGANGSSPSFLLLSSDGNYYGTTLYGGASGNGTIFKLTPEGDLTTLHEFNGDDGANPDALAQIADGSLFGTTSLGGAYGLGTIFKLTGTGTLTTLFEFNGDNGLFPNSLLQGTDGNFYGTTSDGGVFYCGIIFKMTPSGEVTTMFDFDLSDGLSPAGQLVESSDGDFYGVTLIGGAWDGGTAYRISKAGEFTLLLSFRDQNGYRPNGALVLEQNGELCGVTASGNIFRMTPEGEITNLVVLDSAFAIPTGLVIQSSDGNLYGVSSTDTASIYCVSDFVPSVISQPASQTVLEGNDAIFAVVADGSVPLSYQWKKNGVPLDDGPNISGSGSSSLTLNCISQADAGSYSVAIMNIAGSTVSSNAVLSVRPRARFGSLVLSEEQFKLTLTGEAGASYFIETSTNLIDWISVTNVTATNGACDFIDPLSDDQRFYRAITE